MWKKCLLKKNSNILVFIKSLYGFVWHFGAWNIVVFCFLSLLISESVESLSRNSERGVSKSHKSCPEILSILFCVLLSSGRLI